VKVLSISLSFSKRVQDESIASISGVTEKYIPNAERPTKNSSKKSTFSISFFSNLFVFFYAEIVETI